VPTQVERVTQHKRECVADRESLDDDTLDECEKKMCGEAWLETYCIEGYRSGKLMSSITTLSQTQDGSRIAYWSTEVFKFSKLSELLTIAPQQNNHRYDSTARLMRSLKGPSTMSKNFVSDGQYICEVK
jgi:hypothetical protein